MASNGSNRPICIYAEAALKKNGTKLLVVISIGIALALYGVYVQARSRSNPHYMPTITIATHWFYTSVASRFPIPGASYMNGCGNKYGGGMRQRLPHALWRFFVSPIVKNSGFINGMINVVQIALLKMYCCSLKATDAIIALSAIGWLVSMICLFGAFASCKLMCISCLGVHHLAIIYLAVRRRKIVQNILCPQPNVSQSCTFGVGSTSAPPTSTPQRSSGTQTNGNRFKSDSGSDAVRRRSTRN